MKKQVYTTIVMIALVTTLAVAAQAQNRRPTQLIANIPFQFNVGSVTLPAGEYRLLPVSNDSSTVILSFRSSDGNASAMFQAVSVERKPTNRSQLIFHRYGNRYFFSQAWVDGERTGFEASKSRAERATEREFARIKMASESVAVTANR